MRTYTRSVEILLVRLEVYFRRLTLKDLDDITAIKQSPLKSDADFVSGSALRFRVSLRLRFHWKFSENGVSYKRGLKFRSLQKHPQLTLHQPCSMPYRKIASLKDFFGTHRDIHNPFSLDTIFRMEVQEAEEHTVNRTNPRLETSLYGSILLQTGRQWFYSKRIGIRRQALVVPMWWLLWPFVL